MGVFQTTFLKDLFWGSGGATSGTRSRNRCLSGTRGHWKFVRSGVKIAFITGDPKGINSICSLFKLIVSNAVPDAIANSQIPW